MESLPTIQVPTIQTLGLPLFWAGTLNSVNESLVSFWFNVEYMISRIQMASPGSSQGNKVWLWEIIVESK